MFSPVGNKKILLQIKRAKEAGHEDPLAVVMERLGKSSPGKDTDSEYDGSPTKRRSTVTGVSINTGKEHGAFFLPRDEWINPVVSWINRKTANKSSKRDAVTGAPS